MESFDQFQESPFVYQVILSKLALQAYGFGRNCLIAKHFLSNKRFHRTALLADGSKGNLLVSGLVPREISYRADGFVWSSLVNKMFQVVSSYFKFLSCFNEASHPVLNCEGFSIGSCLNETTKPAGTCPVWVLTLCQLSFSSERYLLLRNTFHAKYLSK